MNKSPQAKPPRETRTARPLLASAVHGRQRTELPKSPGPPSKPLQGVPGGAYTIETVDVVQDFEAAVRDNILVTPALILVSPLPRVVILGNLNDMPTVLTALRVPQLDS